jgi:hypothetical protein
MHIKQSIVVWPAFILLLAAGCVNIGASKEPLKLATQPNGATAHIASSVGQISGELLAVQSDGVIVLSNSVIELVPYLSIDALRLDELGGGYDISGAGKVPTAAQQARLAAVSRYPQGIDAKLQARLLSQLHQSELHVAQ